MESDSHPALTNKVPRLCMCMHLRRPNSGQCNADGRGTAPQVACIIDPVRQSAPRRRVSRPCQNRPYTVAEYRKVVALYSVAHGESVDTWLLTRGNVFDGELLVSSGRVR